MFNLTQYETDVINIANDTKFTIYNIIKQYAPNLRNSEQVNRFYKMVETLKDEDKKIINGYEKSVAVKTANNKTEVIKTIEMDLITTLWFVSVFKHDIRLKIVQYALSKKQEEIDKAKNELTKAKKQINKLQASKFNSYDDGWFSMSRIVKDNGLDISVSEALDIMVSLEECKRVEIRTTKIIANEESKICKFDTKRGLLFKGEETKSKLLQLL